MRLQSTMALQEEERQDMAYPLDPNSYKILQKIGCGVSATVYKAICLPMNSKVVAIKAIDLERSRANLDDVRKEAKAMALLSHPNILKAHCSFTVGHHLWVVMPFMSAGSLQSIITSSFPSGLNESCIAIVLKETLNALLYLHDQGHLHRDIKAGNILVDSDGSVKLADFGVSASIYEPNSSQTSSSTLFSSSNLRFNDLAGTPYWMAPEVIHSHVGYSFKADIWSFGITALELAHGRPPLSHLPPWKSLFMRITNRLRLSDYEKCRNDKTKKFSKCFKDMIACCLFLDPSRRPAAEKLLKHPFFKNSRSVDFLVKSVLQGLPTIEERYNQSPPSCNSLQAAVDDDSDEDTEESSVGSVEKHRRISGWNFNDQVLDSNPVFGNQNKEHNVNQVKFHGNDIFQGNANVDLEEKEIDAANQPLSLTPFYLLDDIDGNDNANEIEYKDGEREKLDMELGMGTTDEAGIYMGTYKNVENTISNVEDEEENESSPESKNGEASMVAAAPLVPLLRVIMDSLEDERQVLSHLIGNISGGHVEIKQEDKLQQTITQLKLQLEQEKKRSADLQMELDSLKQNATSKIEDVSQSTYGV